MITCEYCGYGNKDGSSACEKCGAPYKHVITENLAETITRTIRELTSPVLTGDWQVNGYDASSWNGDQNGAITASKLQFGFIRAGYGNTYVDPRMDYYTGICSQYEIPFGLYWYAKPGYDWRIHAQTFSSIWRRNPGQLWPVIDCEYTALSPSATTDWLYHLINEMEQLTGSRVMIYTSPGWWNGNVVRNSWCALRPLWVAHWTTALSPILPYDWKNANVTWTFWQHSADNNGKAAEYGFTGGDPDLDLNRFNGTLAQFQTTFNLDPGEEPPEPPEPPEEIHPIFKAQITASGLNIRSRPTASSTDLGDLSFGNIVPVVEERDGWYHIEGWISGNYTKKV